VVQSVIDPAVPAPAGPVVSVPVARVCADLLELLRGVSDGRSDQGRDHPVSVVLALAAAAVVAGMSGYTAITGWVSDVPAGSWRICTSGPVRCLPGRRRRPRSGEC
jgi:hypothetical protein